MPCSSWTTNSPSIRAVSQASLPQASTTRLPAQRNRHFRVSCRSATGIGDDLPHAVIGIPAVYVGNRCRFYVRARHSTEQTMRRTSVVLGLLLSFPTSAFADTHEIIPFRCDDLASHRSTWDAFYIRNQDTSNVVSVFHCRAIYSSGPTETFIGRCQKYTPHRISNITLQPSASAQSVLSGSGPKCNTAGFWRLDKSTGDLVMCIAPSNDSLLCTGFTFVPRL